MPPHTSSPGCDSCTRLHQKIEELEERVSTLLRFHEAEQLLDTIVLGPVHTDTSVSSVSPPVTEPGISDVHPAALPAAPSPPLVTAPAATAGCLAVAVDPPPTIEPNDSWVRLGAKPKVLVSSTPSHPAPRTRVGGGSREVNRSKCIYDTFNLCDFPPLPVVESLDPLQPLVSSPTRPERPPRIKLYRSVPQITLAPVPALLSARTSSYPLSPAPVHTAADAAPPPPPSTAPHVDHVGHSTTPILSPLPLFPPTTLIVGDSITRHLRFFNATTRCLPGATVQSLLNKLPALLSSLPVSTTRVIVHVGTNDTARQQSELTKKDFNDLFSLLQNSGKAVFISGPIPTLSRGDGRFSRILSLNTWLQSACRNHNMSFIDNFNLFWNRSSLFRSDGVHPNALGSRILAANLQHAVQSTPQD